MSQETQSIVNLDELLAAMPMTIDGYAMYPGLTVYCVGQNLGIQVYEVIALQRARNNHDVYIPSFKLRNDHGGEQVVWADPEAPATVFAQRTAALQYCKECCEEQIEGTAAAGAAEDIAAATTS